MECPLCQSQPAKRPNPYCQDSKRTYYQCHICQLVYVGREYLPSEEREKQEYDLHQNSADDIGYVQFLHRVIKPIQQYVEEGCLGLDFGSGPQPVLAQLLVERGFNMNCYDPFYSADLTTLKNKYDFIVCTEAIEHFHYPAKEWGLWQSLLKPQGKIFIMTKRVINQKKFATWHYKNDQTHVSFFSEDTFRWLAKKFQFRCNFVSADVVVLQKLA